MPTDLIAAIFIFFVSLSLLFATEIFEILRTFYKVFCIPNYTLRYSKPIFMWKVFRLIMLVTSNILSSAQRQEIDSLLPLLKRETRDTSKAIMLGYLSYCYLCVKQSAI